jgi:hypothetical protein
MLLDAYQIIGAFHYWAVGYRPYTLVLRTGRPETGFFEIRFYRAYSCRQEKYSAGT